METQRTLKVKFISASDLENVREMFQMKVYAEISIMGTKHIQFYTPVDKVNETNPVWNYKVKFPIDEDLLAQESFMLVVKLYCKRTFGDRYIGEVCTTVKQLLQKAEPGKWTAFRQSLEKSNAAVLSRGELSLLYKFGHESVYDSSSEEEITLKKCHRSGDDREASFWDSSLKSLADGVFKIIESVGSDSD